MSAGGGRRRHKGGHDDHEEHMDERWLVSFADMMTLMFALFMVLFSISSVNTSKFESLQRAMQDAFSGKVLTGGTAMLEAGQNSEEPERSAPQPPIPAMMPPDNMSAAPVEQGKTAAERKASAAAAEKEDEDFRRLKQRIDKLALGEGLRGKVDTQIRRRGLVIRLITDDVFFASGDAQLKQRSFGLMTKIGTLIAREQNHPVVVEGYTDSQPIHSAQYPSNYELSGARAGAVIQHFRGVGVNARRLSGAMYADRHPVATNSTPEGRAKNRRVEVVLARLHNQ